MLVDVMMEGSDINCYGGGALSGGEDVGWPGRRSTFGGDYLAKQVVVGYSVSYLSYLAVSLKSRTPKRANLQLQGRMRRRPCELESSSVVVFAKLEPHAGGPAR